MVGCQSTSIRPEVEHIIERIGKSYTPGPVGYEGRLTHQDEFIDTLEQVATVDELYQIAASLVLMLYAGFKSTGVDNVAHVVGALGGFLLCLLLYRPQIDKSYEDIEFL